VPAYSTDPKTHLRVPDGKAMHYQLLEIQLQLRKKTFIAI